MKQRMISFSPPDISEVEIAEVAESLRSGWITTGPRTKLLERRLAAYIKTGKTDIDCEAEENNKKYSNRVVCLNSATAAEELNLRILGIGPGDERRIREFSVPGCIGIDLNSRFESAPGLKNVKSLKTFIETIRP